MIEETVARISPFIPAERTLVVGGEAYGHLMRACLPQLPEENFLFEPVGRNTAACVAWAALWVRQRAPEGIMAVLPADHLIGDESEFLRVLDTARIVAQPLGRLVTIGIQPTHAETGYGYIRVSVDRFQVDGREVFRVAQFVEKPSRPTCRAIPGRGHIPVEQRHVRLACRFNLARGLPPVATARAGLRTCGRDEVRRHHD